MTTGSPGTMSMGMMTPGPARMGYGMHGVPASVSWSPSHVPNSGVPPTRSPTHLSMAGATLAVVTAVRVRSMFPRSSSESVGRSTGALDSPPPPARSMFPGAAQYEKAHTFSGGQLRAAPGGMPEQYEPRQYEKANTYGGQYRAGPNSMPPPPQHADQMGMATAGGSSPHGSLNDTYNGDRGMPMGQGGPGGVGEHAGGQYGSDQGQWAYGSPQQHGGVEAQAPACYGCPLAGSMVGPNQSGGNHYMHQSNSMNTVSNGGGSDIYVHSAPPPPPSAQHQHQIWEQQQQQTPPPPGPKAMPVSGRKEASAAAAAAARAATRGG